MIYDRKVLVPYLTELYGLEITYRMLSDKFDKYERYVSVDEKYVKKEDRLNIVLQKPIPPTGSSFFASRAGAATGLFFFAFIGFVLAFSILKPDSDFMFIVCFASGFLGIFVGSYIMAMIGEKHRRKEDIYAEQMRKYNEEVQKLEHEQDFIRYTIEHYDEHKSAKREIDEELLKCVNLREQAYALNIIPNQYRNLGSIAYLYEYFSTSKATDLDQIIQTMILQEVSLQVQNIAAQLNNILSNQECIIEKLSDIQSTAFSILAQTKQIHTQMEMEEIDNAEKTKIQKETAETLKMIKTNMDIANYLSYGQYLKIAHI